MGWASEGDGSWRKWPVELQHFFLRLHQDLGMDVKQMAEMARLVRKIKSGGGHLGNQLEALCGEGIPSTKPPPASTQARARVKEWRCGNCGFKTDQKYCVACLVEYGVWVMRDAE